jgi:hypothetical protein
MQKVTTVDMDDFNDDNDVKCGNVDVNIVGGDGDVDDVATLMAMALMLEMTAKWTTTMLTIAMMTRAKMVPLHHRKVATKFRMLTLKKLWLTMIRIRSVQASRDLRRMYTGGMGTGGRCRPVPAIQLVQSNQLR